MAKPKTSTSIMFATIAMLSLILIARAQTKKKTAIEKDINSSWTPLQYRLMEILYGYMFDDPINNEAPRPRIYLAAGVHHTEYPPSATNAATK